MGKVKELEYSKPLMYYKDMLIYYAEYFEKDELLAIITTFMEALEEINRDKLVTMLALIDNKIKELEGVE